MTSLLLLRNLLPPVDTPETVAYRHDFAIPSKHSVEPRELGDPLAGLGICIARQTPPRRLVEVNRDGAAMVVRLASVVEQAVERSRRDAALLHPGTSMPGEPLV